MLPSYAAQKPGPSGISPAQATAFYEKFAGMAPVKIDGEPDADFAARQTVHQTQLDTLRGAIGREFDMDLVEDARTDAEQAFDAVFPAADPSEIRIDQPLVRDLANGADVVANWQQALAPIGLPAAIASQVGSAILETSNRLADADESTMAAHWSRERALVERIAARQGMNWDAVSRPTSGRRWTACRCSTGKRLLKAAASIPQPSCCNWLWPANASPNGRQEGRDNSADDRLTLTSGGSSRPSRSTSISPRPPFSPVYRIPQSSTAA